MFALVYIATITSLVTISEQFGCPITDCMKVYFYSDYGLDYNNCSETANMVKTCVSELLASNIPCECDKDDITYGIQDLSLGPRFCEYLSCEEYTKCLDISFELFSSEWYDAVINCVTTTKNKLAVMNWTPFCIWLGGYLISSKSVDDALLVLQTGKDGCPLQNLNNCLKDYSFWEIYTCEDGQLSQNGKMVFQCFEDFFANNDACTPAQSASIVNYELSLFEQYCSDKKDAEAEAETLLSLREPCPELDVVSGYISAQKREVHPMNFFGMLGF